MESVTVQNALGQHYRSKLSGEKKSLYLKKPGLIQEIHASTCHKYSRCICVSLSYLYFRNCVLIQQHLEEGNNFI